MADVDEVLRLDYGETAAVIRSLADVRFKLLAFVPTVAGAAVAFLSRPTSSAERFAVGLVGLVATFGVFIYELRNSQLYDAAIKRAQVLEGRLGLLAGAGNAETGGVYSERPPRSPRLLGSVAVWHERALSLVYASALAGWSYLVAWGGLHLLGAAHAQKWAAGVAVLVAVLVVADAEFGAR